MKKQKVGLLLFWIAVIWAISWGVVGSVLCSSAMNSMTMEELNQSIWALTGSLMFVWGIFGVPLAAAMAMIGMFLYSGAKGSKLWISFIGVVIAVAVGLAAMFLEHLRVFFGIGGSLILLFFFGILWFWAKERMALKDVSATVADLKLIGYVFLVIASWFICGGLAHPFLKVNEGIAPTTPIHIMIYMVLGWFFLFLSHYKAEK